MPESIQLRAPAKVNLFLEVLGRRPDGYHDILSVFQAISLSDIVTVRLTEGCGTSLACSRKELETSDNLAFRAAEAFRRAAGFDGGIGIELEKAIPVQGGLGGGSSDAAAVLKGLNELLGGALGSQELARIGAEIGSDVPFFLSGGTARVTGRGEHVEPIECAGEYTYVVYYPGFGVSTAAVYGNLRRKLTDNAQNDKLLCSFLAKGELDAATDYFHNRLEETAFELERRLIEACATMQRCVSTRVMLCGSGASLFSAFVDADRAQKSYEALKGIGEGEVFLAKTFRGNA
jgi:4-diphosphocytidyl-2-C-methyl-D-erythritol kinase